MSVGSLAPVLFGSPAATIRRGLVDYWPLASAGAVDLRSALYGGAGPHDLTNNGVTRTAGPSANLPDAAAFAAASSQHFTQADITLGGKGSFEVIFPIYLDGTTGERVAIGEYDAGNNQRSWMIQFGAASAVPRFSSTTSGAGAGLVSVDGAALSNQTWTMLGLYFNQATQKVGIYLNAGTPVEATQTSIHASTSSLVIGARGNTATAFFNGREGPVLIREGRLFSQTERSWYYNGGNFRNLTRAA